MKKFILILLTLCLTGCISNEDFEKTCTKVINSENIKDTLTINVTYDNKSQIKKAIITKNYQTSDDEKTLENIKTSIVSYNEKYAFNENIKITVSKDEKHEWEVKYYLTVPNLDKDILDEFMLKNNSVNFFSKMKEENIKCN